MKGFFCGNPSTGQLSRSESNQIADSLINIKYSVPIAIYSKLQQENNTAAGQMNDSISVWNFSEAKEPDQCRKCLGPELSSEFKPTWFRKASLLPIIPAHCGAKKLHPFAILGLGLLGLSIASYFMFAFSWIPGFVLLLSLVFFIMSIVAFIIARKKTLQTQEEWSGIKLIKTMLTIEVVLLVIFLIAFVAVWFLVITI